MFFVVFLFIFYHFTSLATDQENNSGLHAANLKGICTPINVRGQWGCHHSPLFISNSLCSVCSAMSPFCITKDKTRIHTFLRPTKFIFNGEEKCRKPQEDLTWITLQVSVKLCSLVRHNIGLNETWKCLQSDPYVGSLCILKAYNVIAHGEILFILTRANRKILKDKIMLTVWFHQHISTPRCLQC